MTTTLCEFWYALSNAPRFYNLALGFLMRVQNSTLTAFPKFFHVIDEREGEDLKIFSGGQICLQTIDD